MTLGFLAQLESLLGERHGDDSNFRLAHYFDLIAGTSTGAIIAAALAKGMTVAEVTAYYLKMREQVFERNWFRRGVLRARYDDEKLKTLLKEVLGSKTTLGDEALLTALLLMAKRLDTGSPWPLSNNPRGRYFTDSADGTRVGNALYPLWQVVPASTAAPSLFDPETFTITRGGSRRKAVEGTFVDGGVSPFNDPSLQAFMHATIDGYRVNRPTGAENILLVSVGTGDADPQQAPATIAAAGAIQSLLSLLDDCGALVETMLQWMSSGTKTRLCHQHPTIRTLDRVCAQRAARRHRNT